MTFRLLYFFLVALGTQLCCGCAASLVYSPSQHLPAQPLTQNSGEILGAVGLLPETRPLDNPLDPGAKATTGGEIFLRYAFSNTVTLQVKGWASLPDLANSYWRGGLSLTGFFMLSNDPLSRSRLALIPVGEILMDGNSIEGQGVGILLGAWFRPIGSIHPYVAGGPIFGFRDLTAGEWGYGGMINVGGTMEIIEKLDLHLELSAVFQRNEYDDISHLIASPSVGIGYRF